MEGLPDSNLGFLLTHSFATEVLHILSPRDVLMLDNTFFNSTLGTTLLGGMSSPVLFLGGLMLSHVQRPMPKKEFKIIWRVEAKQKQNKTKTVICMHPQLYENCFSPYR